MSMEQWEYGDEKIDLKEAVTTVCSIMIGVGILTLPRAIAKATESPDGWISILIGGCVAMLIAWMLGTLCSKFRGQTFLEFAASQLTKPVATVVAVVYIIYFSAFCAFVIRSVAELAKQYLFERTPLEVVSLSFLLVVIYAVSGSRVGIMRLTTVFLPFVLIVTALFLLLSVDIFEPSNLLPVFNTEWSKLMAGTKESIFSFLGFEAILFYSAIMRKPKLARRAVMTSVLIATLSYVAIVIFAVAIFSPEVTQNIVYPTLELAREVSVPGEFFERLESLFFIFWLVSIFCTTSIAMDVSVQASGFIFGGNKKKIMYVLAPIIYLISIYPENISQLTMLGVFVSMAGLLTIIVIPGTLLLVASIRRGANQ